MSEKRVTIRFFLDQNVADSVGRTLQAAGHDVLRVRDVMPTDSADPEVEATAEADGRVLVSHDRDFRLMGKRIGVTRRRLQALDRVRLECSEPEAAIRVEQALSLIEHEWGLARQPGSTPMVVAIGRQMIRTHR